MNKSLQERPVRAVLFDMDGTLVLSEARTDAAIRSFLASNHIEFSSQFDFQAFHGITWQATSEILKKRYPLLDGLDIPAELQSHFHETFMTDPPQEVPGAVKVLTQISAILPVAIVTSSNRESLELVMKQLGITHCLTTTVCAEDCESSKPSPGPFLLAAERLMVAPEDCLIFEDSKAGVDAGIASGARVIAVGSESGHTPSIRDFEDVPPSFLNLTWGV